MFAACFSPAPGRAQIALVVGNSAYAAFPKLTVCDLSANLAAASLTRAGFRVSRMENPSNARMGTAIAAIGDEIAATPGTPAVIYVCGYVAGYAERLFLLPVEARLERDTDVLSQGIVARALLSAATAGNAAALVLIDAASQQSGDLALAETLARPSDLAHAGFAAARIAPGAAQAAAPLAAGLAEILRSGNVELAAAVAELSKTKTGLVVARPPAAPIWLVGQRPALSPPGAVPPASATLAPPVATPGSNAATPPALADTNQAQRRRLQLALQKLGYYHGSIDGRFERDTELAIRDMQREAGEPATGRLTAQQVQRLLDH